MFGRDKKKDIVEEATRLFGAALQESQSKNMQSSRTTSYRQGMENAPPVVGAPKTTSYKSPMQFNARGYETIN